MSEEATKRLAKIMSNWYPTPLTDIFLHITLDCFSEETPLLYPLNRALGFLVGYMAADGKTDKEILERCKEIFRDK